MELVVWGVQMSKRIRRFMPGCTHPGVKKGCTCPLCGRQA
jgi:hypothetical protein